MEEFLNQIIVGGVIVVIAVVLYFSKDNSGKSKKK
jgi:hypothetical protein